VTASSKPTAAKATRARTDGRRTLLVYLDGDLIKNLKKVALDEERNVYEIVEEATRAWLNRRGNRKPKASVNTERDKD
jgi:post-segregation antitoxin (ccd killing protein)